MKIKYLLFLPLLFVSAFCFADVLLKMVLLVDGSPTDFQALQVTTEKSVLLDDDPYKVEGQLVSENNSFAEVWFEVYDDSEMVLTGTMEMYWEMMEVMGCVYDSGGEDKVVQLAGSPLYLGDNPT